ncbi:MAG: JAB domain-containing protein [Bacteroidia bacterium]
MKNKFASIELKFRYFHYSDLLMVDSVVCARELFLSLWEQECQCKRPTRYVLFLNFRKQLITWKRLRVNVEYSYYYYAREIAGMAVACDASYVIMSHQQLAVSLVSEADKNLQDKTIDSCRRVGVQVLDYLIVTPPSCAASKMVLENNRLKV